MNRTAVFVVLGFSGMILLAAAMVWFPPAGTKPAETGVRQPAAESESAVAAVPSADVPAAGAPAAAATAAPQADLRFPTWPKPSFVLVATAEQRGYFEPCGCTANQLGGMTRRAGLFRQLESLGWAVRGVDAGSISSRTGSQAQMKFEATLEALRQLKYVGLAVGPEELRLEPGYLLSQHLTDGDEYLGFLSANLTFFGSADVGTPLAMRVIEIGGVKVGVTSVMSETIRREVLPEDSSNADVTWSDPAEALQRVLKQFEEEQVQVRILLSQSTLEESRKLAEQFQGFDVVVSAQGFGEGESVPEQIGRVRLVQVGEKGRTAGVLGFYPQDSEQSVRYELVTLSGPRFGDDEAMVEIMRGYQQRLRDERMVVAQPAVGHPSGAGYVGSAKCGECHTKALQVWQNSAHAHGLESLDPAAGRPGAERLHGINRAFDPECLSCHVGGWDPQNYVRYHGGFLPAEQADTDADKLLSALLPGNQCENCHGPGSRHVELIEAGNTEAAASEVRVTLEQARGDSGCVKCHDGDNSPEFSFDSYWQQIRHPDRD
ncbi:MAG: multiheme c-type cytochrome [Planctomyces sp.]|jgi:hypothetical protein